MRFFEGGRVRWWRDTDWDEGLLCMYKFYFVGIVLSPKQSKSSSSISNSFLPCLGKVCRVCDALSVCPIIPPPKIFCSWSWLLDLPLGSRFSVLVSRFSVLVSCSFFPGCPAVRYQRYVHLSDLSKREKEKKVNQSINP